MKGTLMYYIVFDMEFNQDPASFMAEVRSTYPFEIIQIGAVKLDEKFHTIETFNHYVKPSIYKDINPVITELTGITTNQLQQEKTFPMIYDSFLSFTGHNDSVFCTWGMSDLKQLYRNCEYHGLDFTAFPDAYINLQPYASLHLGQSKKKLLNLKFTVEALHIPITQPFHDALSDSYYTAKIFEKIYQTSMKPKKYSQHKSSTLPRQIKKTLDSEMLITQFEKMLKRTLTEEEKRMVILSYHMGKTGQFLK